MALFGRKTEKKAPASIYLLMDRNSHMLARGKLRRKRESGDLIIDLIEGNVDELEAAEVIQAVPQDKSLAVQMTRFDSGWDDTVTLTPMRDMGSGVRRNFRVPVAFESFAYPHGGGRTPILSQDLSCGGIAFYSFRPFAVGDLFQVVIPLTSEGPLLLNAEILRVHFCDNGSNLYAAKFVDMIDDEEAMVREAVFAIQLSATHTGKKGKK